MKLSPQEKMKFDRLLPSKFSASGFLGNDARTVEEIISEDISALKAFNVTHEDVALFLKDIHQKARAAFGNGIEITQSVTATHFESRGKIPSPFVGDGVFEKGETVVENKKIKLQFSITDLSIMLIDKHAFFQGKGSPYRIEPSVVAELIKSLKK
jgi:hypothetical protein